MKIEFINQRWTGNALYSQAAVNKILADTWPKISQFILQLRQDKQNFPRFRSQLFPLQQYMRHARSLAFLDHAQFFIIYGQIAQVLKNITEEYHRRRRLQIRANGRTLELVDGQGLQEIQ